MTQNAPKIALICGSLRKESINHILLKALQKRVKAAGAKASEVKLSDYEMPLYHGDLKTPPTVKKLIRRLKGFDGVIIVTPEYNGCLPPFLRILLIGPALLRQDIFPAPFTASPPAHRGP